MLERWSNIEPQPLPLASLYVRRSLLSVASYPKRSTKVRKIPELYYICRRNFRPSGEIGHKKGARGHRAP